MLPRQVSWVAELLPQLPDVLIAFVAEGVDAADVLDEVGVFDAGADVDEDDGSTTDEELDDDMPSAPHLPKVLWHPSSQ